MNLLEPDSNEVIGIRPEHLQFDPAGLPCRLLNREWHGASQHLLLESSRGNLRMVCSGDTTIEESSAISWNPRQEHCFDAGNGQRLNRD